ncbi:uncharacterized protein LOC107615695 [Arachis ipaensis]|uniref:uncharacterized protein LOC107615695 n=1 Tax=Arachis ipaensis TaxID=130454 RepID=UPI0007AF29A2|nr:uncharacterized protein LOC107615695 [Arachis ipaensis]
MSGGFLQGESYDYGQFPPEQKEYKVIHLRSGKVADLEEKVSEEPVEREAPEEAKEKEEHAPSRHPKNHFLDDLEKYSALSKAPEYKPKMPYPQRLQKASKDKQFSRFLEVFRKLQINIPFAVALEQMLLYAKFIKELLTNKRNWKESEIMRALCDIGASINLMPLFLMRKLQIDEVKPTCISLQLADCSIKFPLGVVENLLVKVGPFIFPADFVMLDMEEDKNAFIILGRPFLVIGRALIDVQKGELTLRVNEEKVVLNVLEALQRPNDFEGCIIPQVSEDRSHED